MSLDRNIRKLSINILDNVFLKGKNLKTEYETVSANLSSRDSSFLKFSVYGIVRIKRSLDDVISRLYLGNFYKINETNKNILRLGLFQIEFMNSVPNYAAVNTAVEIAKQKGVKFSKTVNAILNRFIRENKKIRINSSLHNYSYSILDSFKSDYTEKEVKNLCDWYERIPFIWLRIENSKDRKLIFKIYQSKTITFGNNLDYLRIKKLDTQIRKFIKNGSLTVQSPGSGLVVRLLNVHKNETVIDACAAPGGKSRHLLQLINNPRLLMLNDFNQQRYIKMKEDFGLYDTKFSCKDSSEDTFSFFDKILLDVPCSSSGTISKNPDIKWKKIDFDELSLLQSKILQNMSSSLKSGGALVYSTCSILEKENFRVVRNFLDLNRNFKIDNASKYIDNQFVDSNGCINIFPPKYKLEGVFAVRLIKI